MTGWACFPTAVLATLSLLLAARPLLAARDGPWPMHVIDATSRGADGVRLADVNGDGLMDIAVGWEEGGITRAYLHPGHDAVAKPWPAVTVGKTPSVEDAVFVDLDADGRVDVVSCCEGRTRAMFVHWAPRGPSRFSPRGLCPFSRNENGTVPLPHPPRDKQDYLNPAAWKTQSIPDSQDAMMWMFCVPMQVDGRHGVDLVAGAKGGEAQIGWFEAPDKPRQLDQWKWHAISPAGWIMSLRPVDLDGDGDLDIITTDRKGPLRGCRWLENPGPGPAQARPWANHFIGGRQSEVMFMTLADLDGDGTEDVLLATRPRPLLFFRRVPGKRIAWELFPIALAQNAGTGKGVAVGDVNRDGRPDIVFSCENAAAGKSGVMWLSGEGSPMPNAWRPHEVSGPAGIKFDRIELIDLDGDADLDVVACEESQPVAGRRRGLGVFWYENRTVR